jgi:hypothetical protein
MKWIFEKAIRPHTEKFGREIFLCSTCEPKMKRFSFDAVIQHYAAKHTTELSHGNAVVSWKANWPSDPPFHPAPDTVWNREADHRTTFGSQYATSQYAGSQYAGSPPYFPNQASSWMSPMPHAPPPGQLNGLYNMQSDELVSSARQVWETTEDIRDLSDSVRIYVIIHQVVIRLTHRFTNEPTFSMFADCVNHKPTLRPLKDLRGLRCKSCRAFGNDSYHSLLPQTPQEYYLPELLDHFQKSHLEVDVRSPQRNLARPIGMSGMDAPRMDWKFDMIELQHESVIRNLMFSPGINLQKLQTISSVLPHCFPQPLPPIEPIPFDDKIPGTSHNAARRGSPEHRYNNEVHGWPAPIHGPSFGYEEGTRPATYARFVPYQGRIEPHYGHDPDDRPRRDVEVVPTRDIVYVEGPYDRVPRIEYVRSYDQHNSRQHYLVGTAEEIILGQRHRDIYEDNRRDPRPRYSPVVDDMPGPSRGPTPPGRDDIYNLDYEERPPPADTQQHEVRTATENFLSNFDSIGVTRSTGHTPRQTLQGNVSPSRFPQLGRGPERDRLSHATTPNRARLLESSAMSRGSGSRRRSPTPLGSDRARSRNLSPMPAHDGGGRGPAHSPPRSDLNVLEPPRRPETPSPVLTRPTSNYERETRMRLDGPYGRRLTSERVQHPLHHPHGPYRDNSLPMAYSRYSVDPQAPEVYYRRFDEPPIRYIEVLPNGQERMIEEYPAPRYAPVEHAQIPVRQDRYDDRQRNSHDAPPLHPRYVDTQRRPYDDPSTHPLAQYDGRMARPFYPSPPPLGMEETRYQNRPISNDGSAEPRR